MDILLFGLDEHDDLKSKLQSLQCKVEAANIEHLPNLERKPALIFLSTDENAPPPPIDPNTLSVLYIDTTYVEHAPSCYAFSIKWVDKLLPIALTLFAKDSSPEQDAEIEKLFRDYRRTIFTKLQLILDLFEKACSSPEKESLALLKHHIHKTAGSAGSYGFEKASIICKELEPELANFISHFGADPSLIYPTEKKESAIQQMLKAFSFSEVEKKEVVEIPQRESISEKRTDGRKGATSTIDFFFVDDDEQLLKLIKNEAEKRNISFEGESNFAKAKERIQNPSFVPKVAFFDLSTPNESITGYDLIQAFHEAKNGSLTTLLGIMSAKGELPELMKASNLGIDVFFKKPVDIPFLLTQIEKVSSESLVKKSGKILLLNDDDDFCKLVDQSLKKGGFNSKYLTSPETFLPTIEQFHPDIILLDLSLTEQKGIEILHVLHTDFRFRDIPVIIVTASTNIDDVKQAYAAGARDYLSKPIDYDNLPEYLRGFLLKKEYFGIVYEKDPDYGLYTENSLSNFFSTFSLRASAFCCIFIHVLDENGRLFSGDRGLNEKIKNRLATFLSVHDVIGKIEDAFVFEILDYTPQQLLIMLETLHEMFRREESETFQNRSLLSIITCYPNDGNTFGTLKNTQQRLLEKQELVSPWAILTSEEIAERASEETIQSVILISSDPQLQTILSKALELRNIAVTLYTNGDEGYQYLLQHFFHDRNNAIILDGDLKDENSNVLLHKIKNIVGMKTPLFFLTSHAKEEDVTESLSLGATRVFSKPIALQVFIDTLKKALGG